MALNLLPHDPASAPTTTVSVLQAYVSRKGQLLESVGAKALSVSAASRCDKKAISCQTSAVGLFISSDLLQSSLAANSSRRLLFFDLHYTRSRKPAHPYDPASDTPTAP